MFGFEGLKCLCKFAFSGSEILGLELSSYPLNNEMLSIFLRKEVTLAVPKNPKIEFLLYIRHVRRLNIQFFIAPFSFQ